MDTSELFAAALDLAAPWYMAQVDLGADQLAIALHFRQGGRCPFPRYGTAYCPAYDAT